MLHLLQQIGVLRGGEGEARSDRDSEKVGDLQLACLALIVTQKTNNFGLAEQRSFFHATSLKRNLMNSEEFHNVIGFQQIVKRLLNDHVFCLSLSERVNALIDRENHLKVRYTLAGDELRKRTR